MTKKLTAVDRDLLGTLLKGSKVFDVGRCPVAAVAAGLDLSSRGFVEIRGNEISITPLGRAALGGDHD